MLRRKGQGAGHLWSCPWENGWGEETALNYPTQGNAVTKAQVKMVYIYKKKDKVLLKCARYYIFSAVDCGELLSKRA